MVTPTGDWQQNACFRTDWVHDAACRDLTPAAKNLFFPDQGTNTSGQAAKAICALCEVRLECLDWALVHNEDDGVWGGLTAPERRRLKRGSQVLDLRFGWCEFCEKPFTYEWSEKRGYKAPSYCNEVCKAGDRREKRNEWRRQKKLGNSPNGVVL